MNVKRIFIIILSCLMIFTCGCWDYKEYEDLALVSAVGFDTDNTMRQVTVTLEYLIPQNGSTTQNNGGGSKSATGSVVVKATGYSIDEALEKIQRVTERKLFFGYMQEIIIGENAAKQITNDIIGYIDRTPNIRTSAYIAVASGKAEDILNTENPKDLEPTSKIIHNLIDQAVNSGSAYPVSILDFEEDIATKGKESFAPMIDAEKMEEDSGENSSDNSGNSSNDTKSNSSYTSSETGGMEDSVNSGAQILGGHINGYLKVSGIAVFHKSRLVGWLGGKSSLGLGWVTTTNLNPYECVKTSSEQNVMNTLVFRVTKSSCKIKVTFKDGKPVADIDVYVEADLRKAANNLNIDALDSEAISMMEKGLADNVREDVNAAVRKSQEELKTDVLQIGFNLYRQYPELWHSQYEKKWDTIFPTMQINVNVSARVFDTGTSIRKFKPD